MPGARAPLPFCHPLRFLLPSPAGAEVGIRGDSKGPFDPATAQFSPDTAKRSQTSAMATSLQRKVGIASLIMMGSVFASRVMGLVREMVIAYAGGVGAQVDAYQVAFVIPEILNHVVASGFLSVTFIPLFTGYLVRDAQEEAWRLLWTLLGLFGGLLGVLIVAAEIWCPLLVGLVAPGLTDETVLAAAVRMTRIILPAQFFFFAGGLFTAVQFAREQIGRAHV